MSLTPWEGLEAWRKPRKSLTFNTGQRVHEEEAAYTALQGTTDSIKRTSGLNYAQIEGQPATAMLPHAASSTSGGGGRGGVKEDHLATHKLLASVATLPSNEGYTAIDDWHPETKADVDLSIPGANVSLDWAEQVTAENKAKAHRVKTGRACFQSAYRRALRLPPGQD